MAGTTVLARPEAGEVVLAGLSSAAAAATACRCRWDQPRLARLHGPGWSGSPYGVVGAGFWRAPDGAGPAGPAALGYLADPGLTWCWARCSSAAAPSRWWPPWWAGEHPLTGRAGGR